MSVQPPRSTPGATQYDRGADYADDRGEGWVTFAGVMLVIVGIMNVVGGIAAIDNANFYTQNAHFQFANLDTWGWVLLVTGVVQLLAAVGIWYRNQLARWLGVAFAGLNMLGQLWLLPAAPFWSLALFSIDVLVIYGLVAYGQRGPAV